MNYYASWPKWQMPKWIGATLGGAFTLVVIVCAALIVHLTRPPRPRVVAPMPVAKSIAPAPAAIAAPIATTTVASIPPPKATPATAPKSAPAMHKKRTIIAKHDAKAKGSASDIDRLLGL